MSHELFGEPIMTYTTADAINDGMILEPFPKRFPKLCITNTVQVMAENVDDGRTMEQKLIPLIMDVCREGAKLEAANKDTSLIELENTVVGKVWACPNDIGGITIMKPEDY